MIYQIGQLKGVNQDTEILDNELADCSNIVGEANGFSVWGGRVKFIDNKIDTHLTGIYSTVWPDQHETLIAYGAGNIYAIESGTVITLNLAGDKVQVQDLLEKSQSAAQDLELRIESLWPKKWDPSFLSVIRDDDGWVATLGVQIKGGDAIELSIAVDAWKIVDLEVSRLEDVLSKMALSLNGDPRNPTYFTKHQQGNYVIGSNYLRDPAWSWDGNIDRSPVPIATHNMMYRMIESWGGRLWGIDGLDTKTNKVFPMLAFYGNIDEIEIKAGNWLEFRDNPKASRLVAMRSASRDYAYVWGDKGLWQVQLTGSWPLFVQPQLIHADCDCVSALSIVEIPGVGFAWRGVNSYWLLSGGMVRKINLSNDPRRADRIKDAIHACPLDELFRVSGIHYPKRRCVIWSYPTEGCTPSYPWQAPQAVLWLYETDSWYLLDQGWMGAAFITHVGRDTLIVTDPDGLLYEADRNLQYDKDDYMEWYAEFDWISQSIRNEKWMWAILERPMQGTNAVVVSFWAKHQSEAIVSEFTLDEDYDDASQLRITYATGKNNQYDLGVLDTSGWPDTGYVEVTNDAGEVMRKYYDDKTLTVLQAPNEWEGDFNTNNEVRMKDWDPGGPNDSGLPPSPLSECRIPIRLMSKKLKVKLSNVNGDETYNGPAVPMNSLTLVTQ